mmetsp:Transcript_3796/g.11720  ORF Transcript_3796/g.11720 Transcript_3796/m.11720 type:complete len:201 (+) Transcript_3796:1198-1800(+)
MSSPCATLLELSRSLAASHVARLASHFAQCSGNLRTEVSRNAASCARVSAYPSPNPVSRTKSARARFMASGNCRARIESSFSGVMPGRRSTRFLCSSSPAETTSTRSTCLRKSASFLLVSRRSGTSTTTSHSPSSWACRTNSLREAVTSGCTIHSRVLRASSRPLAATAADRAARSMPPSAASEPGKASTTGATAAPPGA